MLNLVITYLLGTFAFVLFFVVMRSMFKGYVKLINDSIDEDIEQLKIKYVYGEKDVGV